MKHLVGYESGLIFPTQSMSASSIHTNEKVNLSDFLWIEVHYSILLFSQHREKAQKNFLC